MAIVTKGDLTKGAYQLLRVSGLTVAEVPEETEIALMVADDYAAEMLPFMDIGWQYPTDYGTSDTADNSGLAIQLAGPFKKLLAYQLVEFYGKQPTQILVNLASSGMRSLEQSLITVDDALNPATLPFGSGNEDDYRDRKFYSEPPNNNGASNVFKSDVLNYTEDFAAWVLDETLATVVWEAEGTGITIASETIGDSTASAELTFDQVGGYTVCITATKTNSTDVYTVNKNFIISDCSPTGMRFN
jgi:hypothetical protein